MGEPRHRIRWGRVVGALLLAGLMAFVTVLLVTTAGLRALGGNSEPDRLGALVRASRYADGVFGNVEPEENFTPSAEVLWEFVKGNPNRRPPGPLPMADPAPAWARPHEGLRITWLGHSTLLVEIDGHRLLTDPVWSDRASPSSAFGPLRFHPPPAPLAALPPLDAVVISHDHYDHLDMASIEALARTGVPFFVPLGIRDHLERWGVPSQQIVELDWWGSHTLPGTGLTLVSTPSRHFSGRGLLDRNRTLWTSWVIQTPNRRVYFSGDTGLTPQFAEIGRRFGPFDVVMLEVGAFHPSWADIHLGPDGAVEALQLLGGGPLLPVHWGTFDLGIHAWDDPARRLEALAEERGLLLLSPRLGVPLEVPAPAPTERWWRTVRGPTRGS